MNREMSSSEMRIVTPEKECSVKMEAKSDKESNRYLTGLFTICIQQLICWVVLVNDLLSMMCLSVCLCEQIHSVFILQWSHGRNLAPFTPLALQQKMSQVAMAQCIVLT